MKKILLTLLLIGSLYANANANKIDMNGCTETQLGNTTTYMVRCGEDKYKVTYNDSFKHNIIDFVELGKTKKYDRTPAKGGEMQRTHNKTY